MQVVVTLAEVSAIDTHRDSVRYVARDSDGHQYTTFREDIGVCARQLQGRRVGLEYHEEQRGRYTMCTWTRSSRLNPRVPPGEAVQIRRRPPGRPP